jgi:hypothetical protein
MKAIHILLNMAAFSLLVLSTLIGLAGAEDNGGGYLWELLVIGSPLLIGIQCTLIVTSFKE